MFKPLGTRILVKPLEAEKTTASGIVLPDVAQKAPRRGVILELGTKVGGLGGSEWVPVAFDRGTTVEYGAYSGTALEVDGEKLLVLELEDVLGYYEPGSV